MAFPTRNATESVPHRAGARACSPGGRGRRCSHDAERLRLGAGYRAGEHRVTEQHRQAGVGGARSAREAGTALMRPRRAGAKHPAVVATVSLLPSGLHPTCRGIPACRGSETSRSPPVSRSITQTLPGVESATARPRRNASRRPSGESAGRVSPTLLKVIGMTGPPEARTAYRSPLAASLPAATTA